MTSTNCQVRTKSFLLGQSISVCIACTSIFTQYLANLNVHLALTQNLGTYFFLSFFLLHHYLSKSEKLHTAWWKYIIVAVIDAEANFLVVKAYEHTTILSVMLCDAMAIPAVVVISLLFLHSKFSWRHYVAVLMCLVGLAIMIFHDWKKAATSGTHRILGDVMALGSAILYSISNICQETLVKHDDWKEYLGMIGVGGSITTFIQLIFTERQALMGVVWSVPVILYLFGYMLCLFLMYVITANFLQKNDAVVFNMHMLTSDVLAAVFTYFFFDDPPTLIYFVCLAMTILGVILYNSQPPESDLSQPTLPLKKVVVEKQPDESKG